MVEYGDTETSRYPDKQKGDEDIRMEGEERRAVVESNHQGKGRPLPAQTLKGKHSTRC
jgi:hypothetical protein